VTLPSAETRVPLPDGRDPALSRNSALRWAVGVILLLALIWWIQFNVGWSELLAPWKELGPGAVGVAVVGVFASHLLRALRIRDYFGAALQGRPGAVLSVALVHNLLNTLLPMRTGEAAFPVLLRSRFGVETSRSVPGLLLFRLLDLQVVLLLGLAVLTVGGAVHPALGLSGLALLAVAPLAMGPARVGVLARIPDGEGRWRGWLRKGFQSLPQRPGHLARTWILTFLTWAVKLAAYGFILSRLGGFAAGAGILGSITGELSSVLPFHGVAGAGTYEAGVVAGLAPLGIPLEAALRGAVNLHLFVLGTAMVLGIAAALAGQYRGAGGD
jgi:uncharacterized membrane protein YbhN (UPF0104 family)